MIALTACIILAVVIGSGRGDETVGKGATASSTEVGVGCFSADSSVFLTDGQAKSIADVTVGDRLLAVDHPSVVASDMMIMMDKETSKQAQFYTLRTTSGHEISLTGLHLMPVQSSDDTIEYVAARKVRLGDRLFVFVGDRLEASPVTNITIESKTGYFAPLTTTGTLLVNNVFSSCYASVKSHRAAHAFMTPFRWYYKITRSVSVSDPFGDRRTNGIHWFIEVIYRLMTYAQSSAWQH